MIGYFGPGLYLRARVLASIHPIQASCASEYLVGLGLLRTRDDLKRHNHNYSLFVFLSHYATSLSCKIP